ncbi:hypothetical protein ACLI1A_07455 [Flavobacterium sp. RHBU_3]|uniref:hypothetical protein n=1 Tax=Flavobacterium sp. RHBU_3 TaxID=3391184 RepID=UPI003984D05A
MKQIDAKHLAYHTLLGMYFLWLAVFSTLLGLFVNNVLEHNFGQICKLLLLWILLNSVIGTSLYMVIRLFSKKGWLYRFVLFSYIVAIVVCVAAITFGINRV